MPNWCNNYLELTGPTEKVKAIVDVATANDPYLGMFQYIMPLEDRTGFLQSHAPEKWGTKWDVNDAEVSDPVIVSDETVKVTMNFSTAWSPPIGIYERLEEEGFGVFAGYYEPGMLFCGIFNEDVDLEYSLDDPDVIEALALNISGNLKILDDLFGIKEFVEQLTEDDF